MADIPELTDRQLDLSLIMTDLQLNFCRNIIAGMTKMKAYVEAGGTAETYATQASSATSLSKHPHVIEFMEEHKKREREKVRAIINDQDKMKQIIMEKLFYQATTDIDDIVEFQEFEKVSKIGEDAEGNPIEITEAQTRWRLKNSDELSDRAKAVIESVETTKNGLKLKTGSRQEARKLLGEWGGWKAPERREVTGANGEPINPTPEISEDQLKEALEKLGFGDNSSQLGDKEIDNMSKED